CAAIPPRPFEKASEASPASAALLDTVNPDEDVAHERLAPAGRIGDRISKRRHPDRHDEDHHPGESNDGDEP
ncbi:MAG: hypothetical protein WBA25_04055, partial [Jannaschia sp.]